jgi:hypothetical protein
VGDKMRGIAETIIAKSLWLVKGLLFVVLHAIKGLLFGIQVGLFLVGSVMKIFLSILKVGLVK